MAAQTIRKTSTRKSNVARPRSKSALNAKFRFSKSQLAIVIGLILVIGGIIVWRVLAATSQTEVETWPASGGNTKTVADNTASGGSYLEFLTPTVTPVPSGAPVLRVSGDKFVDGSGKVITPRGINRAGMEFACTQQNKFITDQGGTNNATQLAYADTVATSLLNWDNTSKGGHAINTVRLPLHEECWLGINGAPAAYAGANYQAFLKRVVDKLSAQGMYVVLDLQWSTGFSDWLPGKNSYNGDYNGMDVGTNKEHSIPFWQQVATAYKAYPNVAFDLYNEPTIWCRTGSGCPSSIVSGNYWAAEEWGWKLARDGGDYIYTASDGRTVALANVGKTLHIAGTQELVNTIRATGATNVIMYETIGAGNGGIGLMGAYKPNDPLKQLAASVHAYQDISGTNAGDASSQAYFDSQLKDGHGPGPDYAYPVPNINTVMPFYLGEYGTMHCPLDQSGTDFVTNSFNWAETHQYAHTSWAWDSGEGCYGPSLVTDNNTGATFPYGAVIKNLLQSKQQ